MSFLNCARNELPTNTAVSLARDVLIRRFGHTSDPLPKKPVFKSESQLGAVSREMREIVALGLRKALYNSEFGLIPRPEAESLLNRFYSKIVPDIMMARHEHGLVVEAPKDSNKKRATRKPRETNKKGRLPKEAWDEINAKAATVRDLKSAHAPRAHVIAAIKDLIETKQKHGMDVKPFVEQRKK